MYNKQRTRKYKQTIIFTKGLHHPRQRHRAPGPRHGRAPGAGRPRGAAAEPLIEDTYIIIEGY